MSDEPIGLPPLRFKPEGGEEQSKNIRQRAIDRQTGHGSGRMRGRPIYPSDIARRQRTITLTLPDDESMDYLKQVADKVSQQQGEEVSPTRLATLILVAGLEQWKAGKLILTNQPTKIDTLTVKPADSKKVRASRAQTG